MVESGVKYEPAITYSLRAERVEKRRKKYTTSEKPVIWLLYYINAKLVKETYDF